jgi:NitT/TauT family transport system substrate-binding protein
LSQPASAKRIGGLKEKTDSTQRNPLQSFRTEAGGCKQDASEGLRRAAPAPVEATDATFLGTLLLLAALALVGCDRAANPPRKDIASDGLRKVTLQLNWYPEMEHGGFYAAKALGYYEDEGLDVQIAPAGNNSSIVPRLVASQQAEFGIVDADQLLMARQEGANLTALAAPLQHSPRCIMVHAESGIDRLEDLKNVTLAMNQSLAFAAFLEKQVPLEGVTVVPYNGVGLFVNDPKYAMQAYSFSEPFVAKQEGADPKLLMVSELGFDPYVGILATSDALAKKDPELVEKMRRASVRGWQAYFDDPEPAHKLIAAANDTMTPEVLEFGDQELRKLALPEGMPLQNLGKMDRERWEMLAAQLGDLGLIDAAKVDLDAAVWPQSLTGALAE